jgi:hypothetical protein
VVAIAAVCAPAAGASTELASNGRGDQLLLRQVLGQASRPLFAATRARGGFGQFTPISDVSAFQVRAATVDDAGGAVAAWTTYGRGYDERTAVAAIRPPGGVFGRPGELGRADQPISLALAGNGRGDAIVTWQASDGPLRYSFRPAGGDFADPVTVTTGGTNAVPVGVTIDGDGSALLVWEQWDARHPRGSFILLEAVRPPGGEFGPGQAVPGAPTPGDADVSFAGSRSGDAMLAWTQGRYVRAIERHPGGDFGPVFQIAEAKGSYVRVYDLALAPGGSAALAFGRSDVRVTAREPGGVFGKAQELGPLPDNEWPAIDVNVRGDAAMTYGGDDHLVLGAYHVAAAARWRIVKLASARPFEPGGPEVPSLALDDSGKATAAWEESDGATVRTFVRDFDVSSDGSPLEVDAAPSFVQERPDAGCRSRFDRHVLRAPGARVFYRDGGNLYGCLLARGVPERLTSDDDFPFPRRTLAIAGPLVAFGSDYAAHSTEFSSLSVRDLRDQSSGVIRFALLETTDTGMLAATRLMPNGAVAWVSCPTHEVSLGVVSQSCERPGGRLKHVWALDSHTERPRLLDGGRRIDPHSFRLRGSQLTWRKRGRLRGAFLR